MNSSHNQPQNEFPWNCVADIALGKPVDFSNLAHGILIAFIVIHAVTCPMTILLNLLVMIAVKTKVRLQSMSNIALACLASTDLMVGLLGQPLLIAVMVNLLKTTAEACQIFRSLFHVRFLYSSVPDNYGSVHCYHASLRLHSSRHQGPCTDRHGSCMDTDCNHSHRVLHRPWIV